MTQGQRKPLKGPRALATLLPKVAEPAVRKRGFSSVEVITHWGEIVGSQLADHVAPERLSFPHGARSQGTLHVSASGSVALELQHMAPIITERINTYFGYSAVERGAITQSPSDVSKYRTVIPTSPRSPAQKLNSSEQAQIDSETRGIASDPLREALRKLGTSVSGANSASRAEI